MDAEERRERTAKLNVAIEEYLDGQGFTGMVGDWLLIGAVVRIDEDQDPNCQYFVALSGGSMLQHTALGLLRKADHVLTGEDRTEE